MKKAINYFTKTELALWLGSILLIVTAFVLFDRESYLTLVASLIGVTSLAYAANDIVLIVLWVLATMEDIHYVSVVVCFAVFFVNDLYGFVSWRRMAKQQSNEMEECGTVEFPEGIMKEK